MTQSFFDLILSEISTPLNLIDVGAAGGAVSDWRRFGEKARIFCFEARDDEAGTLSAGNDDTNVEYVPVALSSDDKGISLTVTKNGGCSSVYPPVPALYKRYPVCHIMEPIRLERCPSITLDQFMEREGLETIDAIKLDTQGSELDVLRGAEKALRDCKLVVLEVEFNELYQGQPLFSDVDSFLRRHGFVLWRFDSMSHYSEGLVPGEPHAMQISAAPGPYQRIPVANGQLFWADAVYVKQSATPVSENSLTNDVALAGAALVSQWNFYDLAMEMVRKCGNTNLLTQLQDRLAQDPLGPFTAPMHNRDRYSAADFLTTLPADNPFVISTDFSHADGCIVYGPYVQLAPGNYEVTFYVEGGNLREEILASAIACDVAENMHRVAAIELTGAFGAAQLKTGKVAVPFTVTSATAVYEFRIFTYGRPFHGALSFYGVSLIKL